ncbi:uncharacterized protein [Garra rufa]|uniref:uncharacterized protein n=1 Tax=Garra rufa TaxID=137080 RepID=UPI003CCEEEE5
MSFKHHRFTDDLPETSAAVSQSLPPTPLFISHSELKKTLSEVHIPVGSLLHKCMTAEPVNLPAGTTQMQPHDQHGPDLQCHKCMSFYHTYVELDEGKLNSLENATKTQSASHVWHDARKLRITASSAKKVPFRVSTKPDNFLREHLFPRFHGNSATRYGQENEELARAWIESTGYAVEKRGMVVSCKEPWLSASPDGILNSSELLEVKCPFLCKNSTHLAELYSSKISDLKMVDGIPQLQPKGSRGYYQQVQLGMFCTGLEKCKLLVWAPNEQLVIDVPFDFQYCTEVISKLKSFYFTHMLPRIVDEFDCGRLKLCLKYTDLCNCSTNSAGLMLRGFIVSFSVVLQIVSLTFINSDTWLNQECF